MTVLMLRTSRAGKKRTRKSVKAMLPSMIEMGTGRSRGCLPRSLNRYSPCSRALQARPGPAVSNSTDADEDGNMMMIGLLGDYRDPLEKAKLTWTLPTSVRISSQHAST